MTEEAGLSRKMRKQVASFRAEVGRAKVTNRMELKDYINSLPLDRQQRIAGLIPHVFTEGAKRPS